ncbi:Hypothetical protein AA314_04246 [Archangium gephyra]|uniref:Uncharacterized protein n=1 Tax=Archangium gephyra TaxID=48 RepID=A0AAC8Q7R4_9BACT|nr:Hypothetical protein AA314_04246 [Archangium gephyra]
MLGTGLWPPAAWARIRKLSATNRLVSREGSAHAAVHHWTTDKPERGAF